MKVAPPKGGSDAAFERELGTTDVSTIEEALTRAEIDAGRRRFTWASVIALCVTAVPFIWILVSDWGPPSLLRQAIYQDNFFELQARAMFHGHLSLANGALGLEGFVHDGRTYTYFGLFPSIIRMPILLVTSSLDGKLTPLSMLLAWLLTGLFCSLLLWRVRFLVRGDSAMGTLEAAAYGGLMATVMGGTIWMLLAATPYVFNEDIAWSICLTVGAIFFLLGVVERPSWGRVAASGVLILCANLDRPNTGWALAIGAGLISLWFLFGLGGRENRRWFVPVLVAGAVIPVVISCAVNYSKFGVLFGVSNTEQVWTHVNAYRRRFLAANHGAEEGIIFVPTDLVTYLRPDGLSISRVFPFITLPSSPPTALNGVLFDGLFRTASLPASTPLLFLLSIWGLVTAFRPKAIGNVARTRLLLLAAGGAGAALMLWGYIGPRYLGDFVPFLVLASAVAIADIFRRLNGKRRSLRVGVLGVITIGAAFSVAANVGMAVLPTSTGVSEWTGTQTLNYVQAQKTVSDLTGQRLKTHQVKSLPPWGPAGQLDVVGNCDGLYVSNGENVSTVPSELYLRSTWMAVELGHSFLHTFRVVVKSPELDTVPLVSAGRYTLTLSTEPTRHAAESQGSVTLRGGPSPIPSLPFTLKSGSTHTVTVTTNAAQHQLSVAVDGVDVLNATPANEYPIHVISPKPQSQGTHGLLVSTMPSSQSTLCQSLTH